MARREGSGGTAVSLRTLLEDVDAKQHASLSEIMITSITADSRQAGPGVLFVAIPGLTVDGHAYVEAAASMGCAAVLVNSGCCKGWKHQKTVCVETADTREMLGRLAAAFYERPAERMRMIGITGTNGKTTTTYLLEALVRKAGGNPGVIGTVNYRYNTVVVPAPFTTPDPVTLHRILGEMAENGVTHVIMEASSHALEQKRLAGVDFDVALFTNLTRDHLDFHGTMDNYFASKRRLFAEQLKPAGRAVVVSAAEGGSEQDWGRFLADSLLAEPGWKTEDVAGRELIDCGNGAEKVAVLQAEENIGGTQAIVRTPVGEVKIQSQLVGGFNLQNLLGAIGVAVALGMDAEIIGSGLAQAPAAPGRLERVETTDVADVFVDYAHTPDALENVLRTLRRLSSGRLVVVFGCGGDRDRGKRPLMGIIAGRLADVVVLTSDNPRSEDPAAIVRDIEQGVRQADMPRMRVEAVLHGTGMKGYDIIPSRREAIRAAIRASRLNDVVVICGKGHEDYQIIGTRKTFFDDRLEAALAGAVIGW